MSKFTLTEDQIQEIRDFLNNDFLNNEEINGRYDISDLKHFPYSFVPCYFKEIGLYLLFTRLGEIYAIDDIYQYESTILEERIWIKKL